MNKQTNKDMAAKIFRINYKSDFILTLESDAGWRTPFCIKFWTGAPSLAYFVGWDGETYTHCAYDPSEPSKLTVQFDDHHLPIGDLKYQVAYHFTVADFPNDTEDEVMNQASITTEIDGETYQVMLDFNGETAPEIQFALPAYANETQRIANEEQRIANEQQRIRNEETRIDNEQTRINQESARVNEYAGLKADAIAATGAANDAAALANQKAGLADDAATLATQKAGLAGDAATLATQKAGLADDAATLATQKAGLADDAATLATQKAGLADDAATLATQKAQYAQDEGDYAKAQGDYAKSQADKIPANVMRTASDAAFVNANNEALFYMRQADEHLAGLMTTAEHNKLAALPTDADLETGIIYDVSTLHPTSGVSGGSTYASLSAALAVIPQAKRKGGMSVKFVQSSDNKYVQFRLMSDSFNTTVTNWQGMDDEPTADSNNLVKSGGVSKHVTCNRYLIDGTIQVFSGYVSGPVGNTFSIVTSSTRHYCIVPANPGLSQVILKGCISYQRWDIDASKNIISYGQAGSAVPSNAKFLAFNFEDDDNTYSGATILQNLSVAEQERFSSHDYNCFVRYSTNQDREYTTSNAFLYSQFFRSIIDIKLNGFNKDNPHHLYNLTRDYGSSHKYGIIIRELINGTWTIVFNATKYNVETDGVQDGVNVVTWTSGMKSVTATIDYSLVTANVDVNLAVVPYVFKKECFENFDSLITQVDTLQANALFKQMLGYSVVSDNIANPEDIQTDMYVRSDGVVAAQEGWAVVSAAVIAGQKVTFGGFKLGRGGYYRFQDANGGKVSYGSYADPNGRSNPITLNVPDTAVLLFIDIASTSSPSEPYSGLQINLGDTFLPYDEYNKAITSINNEPLAGGVSKELEERVEDLENSVEDIQEEISVGLASIIADLPVSDGTDIEVGYAYIDLSTSVVKVKLS